MEYDWDQTWDIITLCFPQVVDIKKLNVKIKRDHLSVVYKETLDKEITLDKELSYVVYPEESNWYISDETLYIELSKVDSHEWWRSPFKGDRVKDIPILPRSITEYDDEMQKRIRIDAYKMQQEMKRRN